MTGTNPTPALYPVPDAFASKARVGSRAAYDQLVAAAEADYAGYWAQHARELLAWNKPFTKTLDESQAP
ncbi:acetyl-coenzyme A synthetase N-terminal domain-containing protein, partial [Enterobacter hormaechei]|uniref:acetyl-coenzyme A synthetase N-terminal domain-containing protein n=2 Tax=Pseudomonadota TaxID=1224 RepID=UPI00197D6D1D